MGGVGGCGGVKMETTLLEQQFLKKKKESQSEKDKYYTTSLHMWNLMNKLN